MLIEIVSWISLSQYFLVTKLAACLINIRRMVPGVAVVGVASDALLWTDWIRLDPAFESFCLRSAVAQDPLPLSHHIH